MLGGYHITLITPCSLDVAHYKKLGPFSIKRFEDKYFKNTKTYSELLLSTLFYNAFNEYEYMLIYQLDAFVFSNKLMTFCKMGFDYIGAPIPRGFTWPESIKRVGNGGFSLRRISSFLRVLKQTSPAEFIASTGIDIFPEDMFYAWCGSRPELNFRTPSLKEALEFSVEFDIFRCHKRLGVWLPFGCHGWTRQLKLWKPIFIRFGHDIPQADTVMQQKQKYRIDLRIDYVKKRLLRGTSTIGIKILQQHIPSQQCVLWGLGVYGKETVKLLQNAGYKIAWILDKKEKGCYDGIPIKWPNQSNIKESLFIIISTKKYAKEIEDTLFDLGYKEWEDFIVWDKVLKKIATSYVKTFVSHKSAT